MFTPANAVGENQVNRAKIRKRMKGRERSGLMFFVRFVMLSEIASRAPCENKKNRGVRDTL